MESECNAWMNVGTILRVGERMNGTYGDGEKQETAEEQPAHGWRNLKTKKEMEESVSNM